MTPILPNSRESEISLLGAVLRDPESCRDWIDEFRPDDFFDYAVNRCWMAVKKLVADGNPVELASVFTCLQGLRVTDVRPDVIGDAWDRVPTAANAHYHAGVVRDMSLRRRIIRAAAEATARAYEISGRAEEVLDAVQATFRDVASSNAGTAAVPSLGDFAATAAAVLATKHANHTTLDGLSTGLVDLDVNLGGLKAGELVVIGARPSQGKTALGVGIAFNVASDGAPVLLFSAEMPGRQIAERILAGESKVDMQSMSRPASLTVAAVRSVVDSAKKLVGMPMFIDDRPDMSASRILRTARRVQREQSLAVVVVDYLQLLRSEAGHRNRHEEVGTLAMRLKQAARELSVPFILLSQLSRDSEKASEPTLAHLKESGDIEAHADRVILINRTGEIPEDITKPVEVDLIVAKNRNGPVGRVEVVYDRRSTRFQNKYMGGR